MLEDIKQPKKANRTKQADQSITAEIKSDIMDVAKAPRQRKDGTKTTFDGNGRHVNLRKHSRDGRVLLEIIGTETVETIKIYYNQ